MEIQIRLMQIYRSADVQNKLVTESLGSVKQQNILLCFQKKQSILFDSVEKSNHIIWQCRKIKHIIWQCRKIKAYYLTV